MERYALVRHLQRQRQLVRRMVPGQRLGAYVAQHRLLAAAIGPVPEPSAPAALPWRTTFDQEARMAQPVDAAQISLEQAKQESESTPAQEMRQLPGLATPQPAPSPVYTPIQAEETLEAKTASVVQTRANEASEQSWQQEQANAEFALPAPVLEEQTLDAPEPRHATPQTNERHQDQRSHLSTRKARIEERPQQTPHVSPAHQMRVSTEIRQQAETAHLPTKTEHKTEGQNRAQSEAAALFTSSPSDRSPQEWFALLMQAERRAQAAPHLGHELHSAQPVRAIQRESAAQLRQFNNATQPELTAQPGQPDNAVRPVAYPEDEPQPMQSSSHLSASEQTTSPFQSASLPGRTSAIQFVPAQQTSSNQDKRSMGKTIANTSDKPAAEPISMRARQVLKPLVGFDPAEARIHRGPASARFVSAQQADAVTVGDDIYLAAGHANDEPETLGLLAHELTHVARHHEPRAVPPVLNNRQPSASARVAQGVPGTPGSKHDEATSASDETLATADEEALAEGVERQVTLSAREAAEVSTRTASPVNAAQTFIAQNTQADHFQQSQEKQNDWGNLPAPWEPLPDWLASSSTPARGIEAFTNLTQTPQALATPFEGSGHVQQSLASTPAPKSAGQAQGAPVAQRAGRERRLATNEEQEHWPEPPAQQPEPDLDKLARQVYVVLKRKLEVERRRMS